MPPGEAPTGPAAGADATLHELAIRRHDRALRAALHASAGAVAALHRRWAAQAEAGPGGAAARGLLGALFPAGLAAHIEAAPAEHSALNRRLLRGAQAPERAAALEATRAGPELAALFAAAESLAAALPEPARPTGPAAAANDQDGDAPKGDGRARR